jgi:drug/metabolite transporter (DMT)-like permease
MQKETAGIIYKLLNVLCIVVVTIVNKSAMKDLSAFQAFFLSCLASLIMLIALIKFHKKASLSAYIKAIDKTFLCIALINFISLCAYLQALKLIDMTIVTAIAYLSPIIISLFGLFILRERFSFYAVLALLISLVGTAIIAKPVMVTSVKTLGVIFALISAIGWAVHNLLLKKKSTSNSWMEQAFIILILCVPISLPFAIATWKPLSHKSIGLIVLLGALFTINKLFLLKALAHTRLTMLAPIQYTKLIFAAIFAYLLFGEVVSWTTILGSTLIIIATVLVLYSSRKITNGNSSVQRS